MASNFTPNFHISGTHTFPFTVYLPLNIPSSYHSSIGSVYYNLKCRVTKRKSDEKRQLGFSVINTLNLNEFTIAGLPTRCTKSKMFGYCCFKTGPLTAKISIQRQGFVPGETILVDIEITNLSTKTISKSTLKLFQKDVYYAGHSKMIKQVILEETFCSIAPGDTFRSPSTKLRLPPLPPSGLNGCKIIDISHILQLTVVSSGIGLPLTLTQNIIIGTTPLELMYDQIASPPSADSGVWSPKSDRPMPHYKESLFGGKQFEKDRLEDIQGGGVFTPLYPVYEFKNRSGEDDLRKISNAVTPLPKRLS